MAQSRRARSVRTRPHDVRGKRSTCRGTRFEYLESRRLLATYAVPASTTQIDSMVHDGTESIIKQGDGTLVLSGSNTHSGGTVVEQGTLVVRNLAALGSGVLEVRSGAKLVLDGGSGTFAVSQLVLQPGGQIDVGTSKLSIQSGFTQAELEAAINEAKGDGSWNGQSGIGSSVVRAMVGVGTVRTLGWVGWVSYTDSSCTVGFAAPGDTDLDGQVDVLDVANIFMGLQDPDIAATWAGGDFNHDDVLNDADIAEFVGCGLLDTGSYLPEAPPPAPLGLSVTTVSSTELALSWQTTGEPEGFEIERSPNGIDGWRSATDVYGLEGEPNGTETLWSAKIGGLKPSESVFLRLRSFNESPSWWWDDRYRSADAPAVCGVTAPTFIPDPNSVTGNPPNEPGELVLVSAPADVRLWSTEFSFKTVVNQSPRPSNPVLKESRIVQIPGFVPISSATAKVSWSVDDLLKIDGRAYSSDTNGSATIQLTSSSMKFDLYDTQGVNWGGNVTIEIWGPPPSRPAGSASSQLDPGNTGLPCPGSCPLNDDRTSHNVNLPTGVLSHRDGTTLASAAAGIGNDIGLEWTSSSAAAGAQPFGNGWIAPGLPQLQLLASDSTGPTWLAIPFSGSDTRVFVRNGADATVYDSAFGAGSTDRIVKVNGTFAFRTVAGDTLTFNDFSSTVAAGGRGQIVEQTDANGNRLKVSRGSDGTIVTVESFAAGRTAATEKQVYTTIPSGQVNAGKVSRIDVMRVDDNTTVRSIQYAYYPANSACGTLGDLKSVTVLDGNANVIDVKQYRYAVTQVGATVVSRLQGVLDGEGSRRLTEYNRINVKNVTVDTSFIDDIVKSFFRDWYAFDAQGRVAQHDVQGVGCSACSAGIGTFQYQYTTNPSWTAGFNIWKTKTVETRPDSTQAITYSNSSGQTLLSVTRTNDGGVIKQYGTYTRYDIRGMSIWTASPDAVTVPSSLADVESTDLMNDQVNKPLQYVNDNSGLIEVRTYYGSTTATDQIAGGAGGAVASTAVKRGELGSPITQQEFTYYVRAGGNGQTFTALASRSAYSAADNAQTTRYTYTWVGQTTQLQSVVESLPVVTGDQNGPGGVAATVTRVYDSAGREMWSKDADGYITFTAYDPQTGAVVKSIKDVDTTRTNDFQSLPAKWATPNGGGKHLVSAFEVDRLGRTVKATDARGSVTYIVYDDVNRAMRVYAGWDAGTRTPTWPIVVSRDDVSGTYSESLTYSDTPAVDAQGRPTGKETINFPQSLTRAIKNAAGQVIFVDRYTSFSNLAYRTTAATLGIEGVNYLRTTYGYDNRGQVDRVVNPAKTITISTYDGLARLTGTYIGTDDRSNDGRKWTPATADSDSNMKQVAAYEYDNGLSGNGNLTKYTQFPGGTATARVTQYAYDWRNRLVATKSGAEAVAESLGMNRPLAFTDYDNLGRVVGESVYDGDGITPVDGSGDGVPDKPLAELLRSSRLIAYDSQDRVFRITDQAVNQATGALGGRLLTNVFYDRRGNVVMMAGPNGPAVQNTFDSLGRVSASFIITNEQGVTWSTATSPKNSRVLEQTEYSYDAAGNVILATYRERFHDASTATTGSLGTPTTGIPARVSYVASYFDAANRLTATVNVGTNAGQVYSRPATVPARSDTVLVTSYSYDAAGQLRDVTDPAAVTSRTLYDALGRTKATIANVQGNFPEFSPGLRENVTTQYGYDSQGRLETTAASNGYGGIIQTTRYVYGASLTAGSTITSHDVPTETWYPDPTSGQPSADERDVYTVNALGERTSLTDRAGTKHLYSYDLAGRLTTDAVDVVGSGVDDATRRIRMSYDPLGRLLTATSVATASGSGNVSNQVALGYNGFGRLGTEWQVHNGTASSTSPFVQYLFSEGVGGNHSRLTQVRYPSGYNVNYTYSGIDSAVSRPSSLTGLSAGSTAGTTLEAFKYLGTGTVIERSRPEVNVTLSMVNFSGATADAGDKYTGLDRFGRVADQRWTKGTAATSLVVDRYGYGYDRNSNRRTRSNALQAVLSETYDYDGLNQITNFTRGGTTRGQKWVNNDALGNWLTMETPNGTQTRYVNAQNEITRIDFSTSTYLSYSRTGNLTTDAQGRTLVYDAWNRLVSVKNSAGTEVARYEYDGLNRRITERVGTVASPSAASAAVRDLYYSQDWQVLEERVRTSTGTIPTTADTRFIWSPVYVDAMIARDRNADGNAATGTGGLEQRVYALQDANWNTTAIIAASGVPGVAAGSVINRFIYTPFGESETLDASWQTPPAGSTPATPWSHLFQGLKFTDVTGLASVRNRDYSASLGRFIELDPLGFAAGDNNWYRFVGNSPTGKTDPSGLRQWPVASRNAWPSLPNYGYYLTHPWAMDYDLRYPFYASTGVAVATGGAAVAGVATGVGTVGSVGAGVNQVLVAAGAIAANPATPPIVVGLAETAAGIDMPGPDVGDVARFGTQAAGRCAAPVNAGTSAIFKNGFYEVNGFKFSKYYYEKLWSTGRGAPSLVAKEVFEGAGKGVPDAIKHGFFKYVYGGWEMVYNPVTKEVWHLLPIKP
jgi:RHS repeat-associated protein